MIKGLLERRNEGKNAKIEEEKEMSFIDHLEELRWHFIRSLIVVSIVTIAAFFATQIVFQQIILGPSRPDFVTYKFLCQMADWLNSPILCIGKLNFKLQSRLLSGQFMMHLTSSVIMGIVVSFPYIVWELWRFIKPGLYPKEQKSARGVVFWVSLLFLLGIMFGYWVVAPLSINFLASYQLSPDILNEFDIVSYVSTLITLVLACGILFQLPVLVFFLASMGLITPQLMITYRRHSIVIILIIAAIITPPDIFSQILVAMPLQVLYEISISICRYVEKKQLKEAQISASSTQ